MSVSAASGADDSISDPSGASEGAVGIPECGFDGDIPHVLPSVLPPRLVLTDAQHQTERVLAYWIAVEHARVTGAADVGVTTADARATTDYVNGTVDTARLLSGGNARLHLNLLRSQVRWLRGLKPGELR